MKVTRFTQSCLLIENNESRILIDPSRDDAEVNFGKIDAVLYTHEHPDHFDPELTKKFMGQGIPVYANASTAKQIEGKPDIVTDGQELKIGAFKIKVIELPYCPMPNGSPGPQNVGYLIDGKFFHPGDGKELAGLKVDNLAWPIIGPDISPRDAFDFAKQVSAKLLIPVHYDVLGAKPQWFVQRNKDFEFGFETRVLENGESLDL